MSSAWPNTLPSLVEQEGFQKQIGNNVLRTNMDVGLDKLRKRYTKQIDTMSSTMKLTRTQYTTLETFYLVTLSSGTLPFNFTDPITLVVSDYRFTAPPNIRSIGGNYFVATFGWEKLP